jgi:hypothetical protein
LARTFSAASRAVSAIRRAVVSGRFAALIHSRIARLAERGNASQWSRARGSASSAAASAGGSTRFSTSSSAVHDPSAFAASTTASPAGRIRPASTRRAIRSLFGRDQPLPRLRGVNSSRERSSSIVPARLSTHPTQSASSTASP